MVNLRETVAIDEPTLRRAGEANAAYLASLTHFYGQWAGTGLFVRTLTDSADIENRKVPAQCDWHEQLLASLVVEECRKMLTGELQNWHIRMPRALLELYERHMAGSGEVQDADFSSLLEADPELRDRMLRMFMDKHIDWARRNFTDICRISLGRLLSSPDVFTGNKHGYCSPLAGRPTFWRAMGNGEKLTPIDVTAGKVS